jgi:hypothetical protein
MLPNVPEQRGARDTCVYFGCGGSFHKERPCQCNQGCRGFHDCCHDYAEKCEKVTARREAADEKDCHTVKPKKGEKCWDEVFWAMTDGIGGHPEWYKGLDNESYLEEFQAKVHKTAPDKCPKPCEGKTKAVFPEEEQPQAQEPGVPPPEKCVPKDLTKQCESPRIMAHRGASSPAVECLCPPPLVMDKNLTCNNCQRPTEPDAITFYMYRAQDSSSFPMENVNMADLAGAMWYIHREVIASTPRKFKIERLLRYSVTMKVTKDYFDKHDKVFGPFVAFDAGSAKGREPIWRDYGFVIGCQMQDTKLFNYVPAPTVSPSCTHRDEAVCVSPTWYSLPGPCPEEKIHDKNADCSTQWPGGMCPSAVVTGEHTCTYFPAPAGEISFDEFEGIEDYKSFWLTKNDQGDLLPNGNVEYDYKTDAGIGMDFWDGRHDKENCTRRMEKVLDLFKEKYPTLPRTLPQPPCT